MRLRRTAIAFAHARRSVQRAVVVVVAGADAGATAARSPRHWTARSRHCVRYDAGKTATAKWRRHHDRCLHRGRRCADAERIGGGRQQCSMSPGRGWRGERARSGQWMLFDLQRANYDRLAIMISALMVRDCFCFCVRRVFFRTQNIGKHTHKVAGRGVWLGRNMYTKCEYL